MEKHLARKKLAQFISESSLLQQQAAYINTTTNSSAEKVTTGLAAYHRVDAVTCGLTACTP